MSIPVIAGVQTIGVNQEEVKILAVGWSAKTTYWEKQFTMTTMRG